jgi:ribosomal protein L37AE/L43A
VRKRGRLQRCVYCQGTAVVRRGHRKKKFELVQLWRCRSCGRTFTAQGASGKTYPIRLILQALMLFYQGETRERTVQRIRQRFGIAVPVRTLASWLAEYRELTTYAPMRKAGMAAFPPDRLVRSVRLHHRQVHEYRVHQGKLGALLQEPGQRSLAPIADYLIAMLTDFPHALFAGQVQGPPSASPFETDAVAIRRERHHACRLAGLVLPATAAQRHHDELRQFMLATDSATVAVEVPIYLTPGDIEALRASGFDLALDPHRTWAGHIDVLQIRDGRIHILVYKPGAEHEKPIAELMLRASALSMRTGLRLSLFACAWFDEHGYYEFDPAHA